MKIVFLSITDSTCIITITRLFNTLFVCFTYAMGVFLNCFLANVHVRYLLSPVRLSVVCNARASHSGGSNFRQYFYGIRYLGHPLTSTENFTEIIPEEPLRRGS